MRECGFHQSPETIEPAPLPTTTQTKVSTNPLIAYLALAGLETRAAMATTSIAERALAYRPGVSDPQTVATGLPICLRKSLLASVHDASRGSSSTNS